MTSSTPTPTIPRSIPPSALYQSQNIPPLTPNASTTTTRASIQRRQIYQVLVGQLFDPVERVLVPNQVITIDREAGIVLDVSPRHLAATVVADIRKIALGTWRDVEEGFGGEGEPAGVELEVTTLDMGGMTILPGLVDVHVHCK